jgi:rubrerythrin
MTGTEDGALVIGARCTDEDCDWGLLGTTDPDHWRLVERHRLSHESETGHTTTVETVQQRTLLDGRRGLDGVMLDMAAKQGIAIEWVCPECERTAADLDATRQCPDCDEPFREALP